MIVEIPDDDTIAVLHAGHPTLVGVLAIEIGSAKRAQQLIALGLHGDGLERAIAAVMNDAADYARTLGIDVGLVATPKHLADGIARYLMAGAP